MQMITSSDYTIEKVFEDEIFPITPVGDSTKKIEFVSQASPYFTDLSEMTLQVANLKTD